MVNSLFFFYQKHLVDHEIAAPGSQGLRAELLSVLARVGSYVISHESDGIVFMLS